MTGAFDVQGWHRRARRIPSPNYNERPAGDDVNLIVLHAISLPPGRFGEGYVERFFLNELPVAAHPYFRQIEALRVSAHFLLGRDGGMSQFVSIDQRAWHAGASCWQGRENCNDYSVGIELEGTERDPFTAAQYAVCAALCRDLRRRFPAIGPDRIVGHSDVAPGRKWDPGPAFDWNHFRSLLAHA